MKDEFPHMDLFEQAAESIQTGEYSTALETLVWLHRSSAGSPMLRAFRAVPYLEAWRYLASVYPPALDSLKGALSQWEMEAASSPPDTARADDMRRYATVIREIEAEFTPSDDH